MKKSIIITSLFGLLTACGGSTSVSHHQQGQTPAPLNTSEFIALAKDASCANLKNRMFVIDQQYVLWDKAGNCSDAAYSQTLYGSKVQAQLCSNGDTIAGPRLSCNNASDQILFKTMIANLDKADLGLGTTHTVQAVNLPAGASFPIHITSLPSNLFYGTGTSNLVSNTVIRDKTAWDKFTSAGNFHLPYGDAYPDFSHRMLIATLFDTPNNCSTTQILNVSSNGQKLTVDFFDENRIALASCDPNSTLASRPMNLVELDRIDLPVEFNKVNATLVPTTLIDSGSYSQIINARNLVLKDQASWAAVWAEHNSNAIAPSIDFTKNMVVAVFLGMRQSGCYSIEGLTIWKSGNKLQVAHRDKEPGPTVKCTMNLVNPFYLVQVPKSDVPVEFNAVSVLL